MGVPGLFYAFKQRYPVYENDGKLDISFDNLLIDANAVFHLSSYSFQNLPMKTTNKERFIAICDYIKYLVDYVKPKKMLVICSDGVCPNAKISQQKKRRLDTKVEQDLQKDDFNKNSITPGTEFMYDLHIFIQDYIKYLIEFDDYWKGLNVIYSGVNFPGEGEHKIMGILRKMKESPQHINENYCIYGSDSDLMLLCLIIGLPHISIIRERLSEDFVNRLDGNYCFLQSSILKECINMEFKSVKPLKFEYSIENILTDLVVISFLVGNDFLPNLQFIYVKTGFMFHIWKIYKEFLVIGAGYFTNSNGIILKNFIAFLKYFKTYEITHFIDNILPKLSPEGIPSNFSKFLSYKNISQFDQELSTFFDSFYQNQDLHLIEENWDEQNISEDEHFRNVDLDSLSNTSFSLDSDCKQFVDDIIQENTFNSPNDGLNDFYNYFKSLYYRSKLHLDMNDNEDLRSICKNYIKTIAWNFNYYFSGLPSWTHFYHYDYTPFISDVVKFDYCDLEFTLGEPISMLTQLFIVLNDESKDLLPKSMQSLICNVNSPIIHLFPLECGKDMCGKYATYEYTPLLGKVDFENVSKYISEIIKNLEEYEAKRDKFGPTFIYYYQSLLKIEEYYDLSEMVKDYIKRDKQISKLRALELYPTLSTFKVKPNYTKITYKNRKILTFNLELDNKIEDIDYYTKVLNKYVYCNYPYSFIGYLSKFCIDYSEYRICYDTDGATYLSKNKIQTNKLKNISYNSFQTLEKFNNKGISLKQHFKINDFVNIKTIKYICMNRYLQPIPVFNKTFLTFQLSAICFSTPYSKMSKNDIFSNVDYSDISDNWYIKNGKYKNNICNIISKHEKEFECRIRIRKTYINLDTFNKMSKILISGYINIENIALHMGMETETLLRILSEIIIRDYKTKLSYDVTLNLFGSSESPHEIPGYSINNSPDFYISNRAAEILKKFFVAFLPMIKYLVKAIESFEATIINYDSFSKKCGVDLAQVSSYIKNTEIYVLKHASPGSLALTNTVIEKIKQSLPDDIIYNYRDVYITPFQLIKHFEGRLIPRSDNRPYKFNLLEIVCVFSENAVLPFGTEGIIVSLFKQPDYDNNKAINYNYLSLYEYAEILPIDKKYITNSSNLTQRLKYVYKIPTAYLKRTY